MADKIVILEDENGNNIYPITRGLAADSVDTNAIQDGAVTSSKIDSATYTTTEKVVGTWIDGKPVYRRVFIYDTPVTTAGNIVIGTVGNVDKLLRLDGVLRFSDGIRYMPVPGVEASSGTTLIRVSAYYFNRSSGEITWYSSDTWGNPYLVTFIEYTKITD